jgi:ATP-dependent DNA helicase RecG
MQKIKVFISSVQSEFAEERQVLFDYLMQDALLGKFFEPFIFEKLPAINYSVSSVFIKEVEHCDIYLGLFGKDYGYEDSEGISPTEREFDHAGLHYKNRLIFLSNHKHSERHPKELALVKKAEQVVVRKQFASIIELKTAVYASLIHYLEEKEFIRTGPFDAMVCHTATDSDIDFEKVRQFVHIAKAKRAFPLSAESPVSDVLTQLNLLKGINFTNAAVLLFGKQPQRFYISSEVKCAHFHGTEVAKPIPFYQVFKGDVFQLVDQAVNFVLSKINLSVGDRSESVQVDVKYEIPMTVITEAIVNAVAHRDYTSNGSVQVMLFSDRLEVWNPGFLPPELTLSKLKTAHGSFPANPLLAQPMYLAGYIEKIGSGTRDMVRWCKESGLPEPEYLLEDGFKVIIKRPVFQPEITNIISEKFDETGKGTIFEKHLGSMEEIREKYGRNMEEIWKKYGSRSFDILIQIHQNPRITTSLLAQKLGFAEVTIEKDIKKLKEEMIIKRMGSTKAGYWQIIPEIHE